MARSRQGSLTSRTSSFPRVSRASSGCCNPTHVAFTQDGRLITAEKGLVRIKVYDVTDGEYQELVAGSSLFPREQSLRDIAVDARDRVLVIDPRTDAIRIFQLEETSDETASQPA